MTERTTGLITLRNRLSRVQQRLDFEQQQLARIAGRLAALESEKVKLTKAVGLIDRTIAIISANGVGRIETTVTNGLRLVFDDPTLGLKIVKKESTRGNSYEIECVQGPNGEVHGPFLDTFGGGIANVASFLLRIIFVKRFKMAKFLVLDESFNNVSAQFLPMVSQLLRSLALDGGYTIFAVSHQPILASSADNIYCVVPNPGAPPTLVSYTVAELAADVAAQDFFQEERRQLPPERKPVASIDTIPGYAKPLYEETV